MRKFACFAILAAAFAAFAEQPAQAPVLSDPIDGRAVYNNHCGACHDAGEYFPLAIAVLEEFEEIPDAVLVEVISGRDHVKVVKKGGRIVVDVDTPGEAVHVSVPLGSVHKMLRQMQGWT